MKKSKKGLRVFAIILGIIVVAVFINMIANTIYNKNCIKYVTTFEPVKFENQLYYIFSSSISLMICFCLS